MRKSWNVDGLGCSNAAVTYWSDCGGFDSDERKEAERFRARKINQAYVAYRRSGGDGEPDAEWSHTQSISGDNYVILANFGEMLAVYKDIGGRLNRLKSMPSSLDTANYFWPPNQTLH